MAIGVRTAVRTFLAVLAHLVNNAAKALEDKEISICTFLHIVGAFDNTKKVEAVKTKDIDKTTCKWIESSRASMDMIL